MHLSRTQISIKVIQRHDSRVEPPAWEWLLARWMQIRDASDTKEYCVALHLSFERSCHGLRTKSLRTPISIVIESRQVCKTSALQHISSFNPIRKTWEYGKRDPCRCQGLPAQIARRPSRYKYKPQDTFKRSLWVSGWKVLGSWCRTQTGGMIS